MKKEISKHPTKRKLLFAPLNCDYILHSLFKLSVFKKAELSSMLLVS